MAPQSNMATLKQEFNGLHLSHLHSHCSPHQKSWSHSTITKICISVLIVAIRIQHLFRFSVSYFHMKRHRLSLPSALWGYSPDTRYPMSIAGRIERAVPVSSPDLSLAHIMPTLPLFSKARRRREAIQTTGCPQLASADDFANISRFLKIFYFHSRR
jgi:hypothetical protein